MVVTCTGHPSRSSRSRCRPVRFEQAPALTELYKHVQAAVGSRFAAHDGPKHAHIARAVTLRETGDLNLVTTQLIEGGRRSGGARVWIWAAAALDLTAALGKFVQGRVFLFGRDRHR